ncbi:MAG: hypothetical protein OXM56_02155, partial [Gammaproteobacteria bacterium]|nr:hypothetical protein [Gammaproteobacteria bacterium]
MTAATDGVEGIAWDLSDEYPAADAPEVERDLERLDALQDELEEANAVLVPLLDAAETLGLAEAADGIGAARRAFALVEEGGRLLGDPGVYASCCLSVDSGDAAALALVGRLQARQKRFAELAEPLSQFLDRVPDRVVEAFLDDAATGHARFAVEHSRKRRHEL